MFTVQCILVHIVSDINKSYIQIQLGYTPHYKPGFTYIEYNIYLCTDCIGCTLGFAAKRKNQKFHTKKSEFKKNINFFRKFIKKD